MGGIPHHKKTPLYGWVMVGLTAVFSGIGTGAVLSISVFLKPLVEEFGWLRGEVSGGYVAATLALGVGGIGMGYLADRLPVRRIVLVGVIGLASSYLLLGQVHTPAQFYLYSCLMGGVGGAAMFPPMVATLGAWFTHNRGLALGVATAGQAVGQGLVPYISRLLISEMGWRGAYTSLGWVFLVALLPLVLLVRPAPAMVAAARAQTPAPKEIFPISPGLTVAWLSTAVVFCCICMSAPLIHLVALGQDRGFSGNVAASFLVPIYFAGIFGRILFGRLADKTSGVAAYWIASAGQTVAVFWFTQMASLAGFYALGVAYGLFFSGVMTSFLIAANEMTPLHRRGIANGVVMLFGWIGMALGGWQAGFAFDLTGNYTVAYANAAAAGVINLIIVGGLWALLQRRRGLLAAIPAAA